MKQVEAYNILLSRAFANIVGLTPPPEREVNKAAAIVKANGAIDSADLEALLAVKSLLAEATIIPLHKRK
jgi:hypothetical protein